MNILMVLLALLLPPIEDGSPLLVQNSMLLVESRTRSSVSHVGIIINIDGEPWLYEAVQPSVRKVKLKDKLDEIKELNKKRRPNRQITAWVAKPKERLTKEQLDLGVAYLESQVGRGYSILGYTSGRPTQRGIHCAEMTSNFYNKMGLNFSDNPCVETPGNIWGRFEGKEELK